MATFTDLDTQIDALVVAIANDDVTTARKAFRSVKAIWAGLPTEVRSGSHSTRYREQIDSLEKDLSQLEQELAGAARETASPIQRARVRYVKPT